MQDCGGCVHFIKWRNDRFGGGLCEAKDVRTKSDHGHKCQYFTAAKYDRLSQKRTANKLLSLEFSEE